MGGPGSPTKRGGTGALWQDLAATWSGRWQGIGRQHGLCWGQTLILGLPVPAAGVTGQTRGIWESEERPVVTQGHAPPASGSSLAGCTAWGPAFPHVVTCPPPEPPFLCPSPSMMEYSLDGHNVSLSAIRTVRVLRPLRAINRVPSK